MKLGLQLHKTVKSKRVSRKDYPKSDNISDRAGVVYNEKVVETEHGEETIWSYFIKTEHRALIEGYPPVECTLIDLYLYNQIIEPDAYIQVFHLLKNLEDTDKLSIHINSPGGAFSTLLSFLSILDESPAWLVTEIEGVAGSAAFILAMAGDEIRIGNYCSLMAHNLQTSLYSCDGANVAKYSNKSKETYKTLLAKYGSKVLTQEEIENILEHGHEVYMTAEETDIRLQNWYKKKQKEEDELETVKKEKEYLDKLLEITNKNKDIDSEEL